MKPLNPSRVIDYVEKNIGDFHQKRLNSLTKLSLNKVLKNKNPYLYRAKNVQTADDIIRQITDAQISSSEETIFGDWLEGLAIFINGEVYDGKKSGIKDMDLEFDKDGRRYIVSIKSGPNWGNAAQVNKLKAAFAEATKTLRTSNSDINVVAVNGCCYGTAATPDQGTYFKYCGQEFWEFISGESNLYTELIEPLGHKAKEKNDLFAEAYGKKINLFLAEFIENYCNKDGTINWKKIVEWNSKKKVK